VRADATRREFLRAMGSGICAGLVPGWFSAPSTLPVLAKEARPFGFAQGKTGAPQAFDLRSGQSAPDYRLEIAPLRLEIAPGKTIETVAYNGKVPGPLIRWPENKLIRIQVTNRSSVAEIVHWHGLFNSSYMDGASEEGSPMIAPGASFLYEFAPRPAGFRWYHTHTTAGHNLKRSLYTGQFGCFYIEPKNDAGNYDREIFLTIHDWNAYMGGSGDSTMEVAYDYGTIDGRMLGHADPIRVRANQRVLVHLLNSSATLTHWIALAGHTMKVVAMDGNPVPRPSSVSAVRLAPAERIDVTIEMNQPGVWILGETRKELRNAGIGIVFEYQNQSGEAKWVDPAESVWDYTQFANPEAEPTKPDVEIPLVFQSKFAGHGDFDRWTINGKSFPHTDTIPVQQGRRYRLAMENKSPDPHPIHLHRHSFEVSSLGGTAVSGLIKDVLLIDPGKSSIDFTADNPGATLFHCHQQNHMDFGFMTLLGYK